MFRWIKTMFKKKTKPVRAAEKIEREFFKTPLYHDPDPYGRTVSQEESARQRMLRDEAYAQRRRDEDSANDALALGMIASGIADAFDSSASIASDPSTSSDSGSDFSGGGGDFGGGGSSDSF